MKRSNRSDTSDLIDIGVCIPSTGTWKQEFGKCVAMMFADFTGWRPEGVKASRIRLFAVATSMLVYSRHKLVANALGAGCTHLLFLDSDMIFPRDTIQRLWGWDKDFVATSYTTRNFPVAEIGHGMDGKLVESRKKHGLQKVRLAGLGCAMAKAEVVKKLTPPLFMMDWVPDIKGYCGEDVYFIQKLAEIGVDTWVDHDLSKELKHIGEYTYGHKDIGHVPPEELK